MISELPYFEVFLFHCIGMYLYTVGHICSGAPVRIWAIRLRMYLWELWLPYWLFLLGRKIYRRVAQ